jgi:hypothetical protein
VEIESDMAICLRLFTSTACNDQRLEALARDEILLGLLRGV